jgi:hypothetical protein
MAKSGNAGCTSMPRRTKVAGGTAANEVSGCALSEKDVKQTGGSFISLDRTRKRTQLSIEHYSAPLTRRDRINAFRLCRLIVSRLKES